MTYSTWAKYFGGDMEAAVEGPMDLGNHFAHYHPFPVFDRGDDLYSATSVNVDNETDIDVNNDVAVVQDTEVSVDIGFGSAAIIDGSLNTAPQQAAAIGNFDGDVDTGSTAVGASNVIADGPSFFGFGGFGGNSLTAFADIDVTNTTDIDITNNVTAIQNTVIDLDIGPGATAIVSDALNAAPSQNIAVGNFGGEVDTGVGTEVFTEDFIA